MDKPINHTRFRMNSPTNHTQLPMNNPINHIRLQTILLVAIVLLSIVVLVLIAITLGMIKNQKTYDSTDATLPVTTTSYDTTSTILPMTTTSVLILEKNLVATINSTQLMFYLGQLQRIADKHNRTRSLGTSGFTATVDYVEAELKSQTNFQIFRQDFSVRVRTRSDPVLTTTIDGVDKNYTYDTDYRLALSSIAANFSTPIRLTVVPNRGCNDDDWQAAAPHPAVDSVALVMYDRSNCTMTTISNLAQKYNISALLVYNSDSTATNLLIVVVPQNITYPAMVLSHELGRELVEATRDNLSSNARVRIVIVPDNIATVLVPSTNLCADTTTGNKQQTIVIGSHLDSVEKTSGINDNGSGTMGTLHLALNLAQLSQSSSYQAYPYRIRFCWWGAEENSLLGSYHHVEEANVTTVEGNRLKDYMLMLNFDMLGSPNYYFGIYNPASLPPSVSSTVKNASNKISHLFRQWFDKEKLPWDHSAPILSDYVPFLFAGIPCSGLYSGGDEKKTLEQRNRYDQMIGHGYGGMAEVHYDPCYHLSCDTIENINPFAYATMVKSAAYVLETLARMSDLPSWLYSSN